MDLLRVLVEMQGGLAPLPPGRMTDPRARNASARKVGESTEKVKGEVAVLVERGAAEEDTTTAAHHSGTAGMTSAGLRRSGMVGTTSVVHLLHSTGTVGTTSGPPRQDISGMAAAAAAAAAVAAAAAAAAGVDTVGTVGTVVGMDTAPLHRTWVPAEHQACHRKATRCGNVVNTGETRPALV